MCGIAGFIGRYQIVDKAIRNTLGSLARRGPDFQDSICYQQGDLFIHLLHTRLSIIDLTASAHQPFTLDDLTIIFNGEIYNYLELKNTLESFGVVFTTSSDTEVLLRAYQHFGIKAFELFEGMWSFAIYKKGENRVLLSRDRFGEKPLYYLSGNGGCFFASEVKALSSLSGHSLTVNVDHLKRYLVNGYKSLHKQDHHFFSGVHSVPPGHFGYVDGTSEPSWTSYWRPDFTVQDWSENELIPKVQETLFKAVSLRLRSDVPLAFCLSGGIDSAGLASIASKIFGYEVHTFSIIDPDPRYNESRNINEVIQDLECKNFIFPLTHNENFFSYLERLIRYHDAPLYTISYYIHSFLSAEIARKGFKVAISGSGADELFTGYYDHFNQHLFTERDSEHFQKLLDDWRTYLEPVVRNPYLRDPLLYIKNPHERRHLYPENSQLAEYLNEPFSEKFTENYYCDDLLRNRMLNELMVESVPVLLHEDDLNSMFYSIENRSPYLDSELFSLAYSIPNSLLIKNGYAKYPLRQALKGVLTESVRLDRKKVGFNASLSSLLNLSSAAVQERFLSSSPIFDFVNKQKIATLLKDNTITETSNKFLFNFINAKIFLEVFQSS